MHSSVLETKLSRWSGPERPVLVNIELEDEAEVASFQEVMRSMYHGKLPTEDMTVERVLLIARLADAYAVEIVLCAATEWLNQQAGLAWDDALRIFEAPASVRDRVDLNKAQTAMLERAGDLEEAMNDKQVRKQLIELPESAFVALLSDDRLAVAAESTVVALTIRWAQQHGRETVPDAVATCIRLKHLDMGFLAGVAHFFPLWTPRALALLFAGKASLSAWQEVQKLKTVPQVLKGTNELERPKSSMIAAEFKAVMPLSDLAKAFNEAVEKLAPQFMALEGEVYNAGYGWALCVTIFPMEPPHSRFCTGVYLLQRVDASKSMETRILRSYTITCVAKNETNNIVRSAESNEAVVSPQGWCNFFEMILDSWHAESFEKWADDAGNLNFSVRANIL
eukprot:TRINITY_DN5423_c0_g3_i1.p1 TRINITY_DN5423_c0_g3~~TRINITY_DN5423_c0_g3_i1.p1  ORF type:complete len:395 (-),score=76.55 TRINITY_DN5423_c0_g3_i1:57-1241(-)